MKIADFTEFLKNLFFPNKCTGCGDRMSPDNNYPLCPKCIAEWEKEKIRLCPICGQKIRECYCGYRYDISKLFYDEKRLCTYSKKNDSVGKRLILRAKYHDDGTVFDFLGKELSELLEDYEKEECIITFIPRSRKNIRKIGFDQVFEIASRLSFHSGIPYEDCFIRKGSKEQKRLNFKKRISNAKKSFFLDESKKKLLQGKTVFILDDLSTSGATIGRCSELVYRCKPERIVAITVAKTVR